MLLDSIVTIYPLKIKFNLADNLSLGFTVRCAFYNSLSSSIANSLDAKNSVLSVCMPTALKASFLVVINK